MPVRPGPISGAADQRLDRRVGKVEQRGPGPKWFETHGGGINRVGPAMDSHRHDKYLLASFFFRLVRRWQASSSGISGADEVISGNVRALSGHTARAYESLIWRVNQTLQLTTRNVR